MGFTYKNKKGDVYYLHSKVIMLRNSNKQQTVYYFSKDSADSIDLPDGKVVIENKKTGLPCLKNK